MGITCPMTLDENERYHYPSPLRDDKVALSSLDYEMPSSIKINFGVLSVCF